MADEPKKKKSWVPKKDFHPGGEKGKLHREIGVSEGKKIPEEKLEKAAHSKNPEIKKDAIRAETMKKWNHTPVKRPTVKGMMHKMHGTKE